MDVTGRNPDHWRIVGWLYNDVYYTSDAEFRKAVNSEGFEKADRNVGPDETWFGTDRVGDSMPLDEKAPPMGIQPEGRRFKVSRASICVAAVGVPDRC